MNLTGKFVFFTIFSPFRNNVIHMTQVDSLYQRSPWLNNENYCHYSYVICTITIKEKKLKAVVAIRFLRNWFVPRSILHALK